MRGALRQKAVGHAQPLVLFVHKGGHAQPLRGQQGGQAYIAAHAHGHLRLKRAHILQRAQEADAHLERGGELFQPRLARPARGRHAAKGDSQRLGHALLNRAGLAHPLHVELGVALAKFLNYGGSGRSVPPRAATGNHYTHEVGPRLKGGS